MTCRKWKSLWTKWASRTHFARIF